LSAAAAAVAAACSLRPCPAAAQIAEQYPWLVENGVLEVLLPKKAELTLVKL
jgi:hypothetical protein